MNLNRKLEHVRIDKERKALREWEEKFERLQDDELTEDQECELLSDYTEEEADD